MFYVSLSAQWCRRCTCTAETRSSPAHFCRWRLAVTLLPDKDGIPKRTVGAHCGESTLVNALIGCTDHELLESGGGRLWHGYIEAILSWHYNVRTCMSTVFYPAVPGTYVPVLFVPGVFGAIYTEWYSTVLTHLASYGVIVAGVDVQWPLLHDMGLGATGEWRDRVLKADISAEPETLFKVLNWVSTHFCG